MSEGTLGNHDTGFSLHDIDHLRDPLIGNEDLKGTVEDVIEAIDLGADEIPACSTPWKVIDNYAFVIDGQDEETAQKHLETIMDNLKERIQDDLEKQGVPEEVRQAYTNERLERAGNLACQSILKNATVEGIQGLQEKGLDGIVSDAYESFADETVDFENIGKLSADDIEPASPIDRFIEGAKNLAAYYKETFSNTKTAVDTAYNLIRVIPAFLSIVDSLDSLDNDGADEAAQHNLNAASSGTYDVREDLRATAEGRGTYENQFDNFVNSIAADTEPGVEENEHRFTVDTNPYDWIKEQMQDAFSEIIDFDFGDVETSDLAGREAFFAIKDENGNIKINVEALQDYFESNFENPNENDTFVHMMMGTEYRNTTALGADIQLAFTPEDMAHALHESSELVDLEHEEIFRTGEDNITRAAVTVENLGEDLDKTLFNLVAANYERLGEEVSDEKIDEEVARLKASVGLKDTNEGRQAFESYKNQHGQEMAKGVSFFEEGDRAEKTEEEKNFAKQKLETGGFIAFVDEGDGVTRIQVFVAGESSDLANSGADNMETTDPDMKAIHDNTGAINTDMGRLVVLPDLPNSVEDRIEDEGVITITSTTTNPDGTTTTTTTTTDTDGTVTVTIAYGNPGNHKAVGQAGEYPNGNPDKFGYYDENGVWHDGDKGASNGPLHTGGGGGGGTVVNSGGTVVNSGGTVVNSGGTVVNNGGNVVNGGGGGGGGGSTHENNGDNGAINGNKDKDKDNNGNGN